MSYPYDQIFAGDPSAPERVAVNGIVTIFTPGDATMAPLTITTLDGLPLANPMQVNESGFGPAFQHETLDQVAWAGGGFTGVLTSYKGMKEAAVEAQQGASAAAINAEQSRLAAEEAVRNTQAPSDEAVDAALERADIPATIQQVVSGKLDKSEASTTFAVIPDSGGKPVGKGELLRHSKDFGLTGDGTDEFANLKRFLESGGTLLFEEGKTYSYDPVAAINIPAGTKISFNNSKLHELKSYDGYRLVFNSDTSFDVLEVSFAGGANIARGVLLLGRNIRGGTVSLTLRQQNPWHGNYRRRALSIEAEGSTNTSATIDNVYIEGWEYGTSIFGAGPQKFGATGVTIGSLAHVSVKQGLILRDSSSVNIGAGYHKTLSPHCKGNAGENAFLAEATTGHHSVQDIRVSNFHSFESGEHGFRLGGQYMVKNVTFENCYAAGAGSGVGSGVEPDNHGGCGFKVLGPTSIVDNRARHSNIRFINCTVENLYQTKPKDNFAGFNIGKCINVTLVNPIVRAAPTSGYAESAYAAYNGIEIIGSENVEVVSPIISNVLNSGIVFYDDLQTSTVAWGGGCTMVNVLGGTIRNVGNAAFEFANTRETMRSVAIKGTALENGKYNILCAAGGSQMLNRCSASFTTKGATTANTLNCNLLVIDMSGDILGENIVRGGSTLVNYSTATRQTFKGSGWVTV